MNSYSPFYIVGFESDSGINTYYEPFLIPEKAFPRLEDCYAWRGRIRKRQGYNFIGRLRRNITSTTLSTQANGAVYTVADILNDPALGLRAGEPNAEIQSGSVAITVGAVTFTDNGLGALVGTPGTNSGSINYISGSLTLNFSPSLGVPTNVSIAFSYYPALPVMGLPTLETGNVNNEQTIAFDTIYAYRYVAGQWEELPSTTPTTWNGTNADLFWTVNYYLINDVNIFWATNNNATGAIRDPLYYYNNITWKQFEPQIDASPTYLEQCLILIPYKDRLLAFNTWEGPTLAGAIHYPQRVRWSQNGDPTDQVNGWRDDIVGRGGYVDAYTNEQIISAGFIKDELIVKFERSSWKLVYTGNEIQPFYWQKINAELGAESTFSFVGFDRGGFTVGNYGITTDDSINVYRIDEKIPDLVFNINNDNQGTRRVYGIRDYNKQLVYWAIPLSNYNPTFPDAVLVYNYINSTWSIFNDSFTCFGYFQAAGDVTWATLSYGSWSAWDDPWASGNLQSGFPNVIAGNQQGYTLLVGQQVANDVSLSVTAISPGNPVQITVPSHNLQTGAFAYVLNIIGAGPNNPDSLNGPIYFLTKIDANTLSLQLYNTTTGNLDNVMLNSGGTYIGGGQLKIVNNINITSKVFSPFYDSGKQVRLGYVDFFLSKTQNGEVTTQMFVNEAGSISIDDPANPENSGLIGDNILLTRAENTTLIPMQQSQNKIWHRVFYYTFGQNFQLEISMDEGQMSDPNISSSDFVLHAMTLYFSAGARMTQ